MSLSSDKSIARASVSSDLISSESSDDVNLQKKLIQPAQVLLEQNLKSVSKNEADEVLLAENTNAVCIEKESMKLNGDSESSTRFEQIEDTLIKEDIGEHPFSIGDESIANEKTSFEMVIPLEKIENGVRVANTVITAASDAVRNSDALKTTSVAISKASSAVIENTISVIENTATSVEDAATAFYTSAKPAFESASTQISDWFSSFLDDNITENSSNHENDNNKNPPDPPGISKNTVDNTANPPGISKNTVDNTANPPSVSNHDDALC